MKLRNISSNFKVNKKETRYTEIATALITLAEVVTPFFSNENNRQLKMDLSIPFNVQTAKSKIQPTISVNVFATVVRFKSGSDYYKFEKLPGKLYGQWVFSEPYTDFVYARGEGERNRRRNYVISHYYRGEDQIEEFIPANQVKEDKLKKKELLQKEQERKTLINQVTHDHFFIFSFFNC